MRAQNLSHIAKATWNKRPKLVIILLIITLTLQFVYLQGFYLRELRFRGVRAQTNLLELTPSEDIFISPSTTNGNRRMLFVGTYSDETICTPEGCPPIYQSSLSLLKFDWSQIPSDEIITSAKLQLFHYGSDAELNLKVSKIDSAWNETAQFPGPNTSTTLGSAIIPNFNTSDPSQIQLREINLDNNIFANTNNYQNGFAISPNGDLDSSGAVFCSSNSDAFCLTQYKPKLVLSFVPNNPPAKPNLLTPEPNKFFGGKCDYSVFPIAENCSESMQINFKADNLIDNDPSYGAFSHAKLIIKKGENIIYESNVGESRPERDSPQQEWTIDLENGNYTYYIESYDKKGIKTLSDSNNFSIDTIAPNIPAIQDLADITKPSQNQINIKVKSEKVSDNLDSENQVQYQLQYSIDSSFQTNNQLTNWSNNPEFNLSNSNGIEPNKNYFFRMRSKDSKENISDWSNTAATSIEGLPKVPQLNKSNWRQNRFRTNTFITNLRNNKFSGIAQKNHKVELFINNFKTSESIANQNCRVENNIELCEFSLQYNYSGASRQDSNGQPLNSFSIQLRAIDENLNTSILSNREIIYFDNIAPGKPTINISTDKNLLDIDGVTTTNGSNLTLNINAERYSDIEYKLFSPNGKLQENKLIRIPFNKNISINSNLKIDGKYRLEITSIDGAGNRGEKWGKEVMRDTLPPRFDNVSAELCEDRICLIINGENNSKVIVNNSEKGIINSSNQKVEAIKYWSYGKIYKFNIYLKDSIGNTSITKSISFETPIYDSGGRGASDDRVIEVGTQDYENIKNKRVDFSKIKIKFDFYTKDKRFELKESSIPAPQLQASITNYDSTVDIFGNSIYRNQGLEIEVNKLGYNFNEALEKCNRWIYLDANCMQDLLGQNPTQYLFENVGSCVKIENFIPFYGAFKNISCNLQGLSKRISSQYNLNDYKINDIRVYLYNLNDNRREFHNEQRNDSHDDRFTSKTKLNNGVKSGDKINAKLRVNGKFHFEGSEKDFGDLWSGESNKLTIDPKSDIKLVSGQRAKVLDVPYFNQWVESDGQTKNPSEGKSMCGAATSVMIAGYYNKLPLPNQSTVLKSYMFKNNGQNIVKSGNYFSKKYNANRISCYDGAFGVTGSYNNCGLSSLEGMTDYLALNSINVGKGNFAESSTISENYMSIIKSNIDNQRPLILSYKWKGVSGFGHIVVIKGYTYSKDGFVTGLILNDPYRDTSKTPPNREPLFFSNNGYDSMHTVNYDSKNKTYTFNTNLVVFYFATTERI